MRLLLILLFVCSVGHSQRLINSYRYAAPSSAIDQPSLFVKLTPNSVDPTATANGNAVGTWNDQSGGGRNATSATNKPQLIIDGTQRQVQFVSANTDFLSIPNASVNSSTVPGTNSFTIILKFGNAAPASANGTYPFSKGQLNMGASGQYAWDIRTTHSNFTIGGAIKYYDSSAFAANDVIAIVVRTTGFDVYQNNVLRISNATVGTVTTTNDLILGSTFGGANSNWNGIMSHFLMYNEALNVTQLTNIYNEID